VLGIWGVRWDGVCEDCPFAYCLFFLFASRKLTVLIFLLSAAAMMERLKV
jgi:hypothetical protein